MNYNNEGSEGFGVHSIRCKLGEFSGLGYRYFKCAGFNAKRKTIVLMRCSKSRGKYKKRQTLCTTKGNEGTQRD